MPSDRDGKKPEGAEVVDDASNWEYPLSQLREQQKLIQTPNLSDPGYIRQKANAKLWVRERLTALLDQGSFDEVGSVTGKPVYDEATGKLKSFIPANSVTGFGRIQGRRVFVTADDFSVRGGHADGGIQMKAPYGEIIARKARVPLIRLLDGSSGGGSVATYLTLGATYIPGLAGLGKSMDAMAVVPVISALLGPVVGLASAKAVISHFSVMVKGLSQLFAAGPPIVKQATFEDLSKESLGGWAIHGTNGTVDNIAVSEADAFLQIATFLSFLPSSIFLLPPVTASKDPKDRREEELVSIIPRRRGRMYDMRRVVRLILDLDLGMDGDGKGEETRSTFFEIGETWGRCVITGFARMAGYPVGVLTSDCMVNGGAIDALGSQKTTRFVNLCDHFGIPLLNLVDLPGFAIGSVAERAATIRHGASAMSALYNATIPIYTVIIRRAFGVAGGAFADPEDGMGTRVAWPSADWGSLPLEGGIEAAYKRQLDSAPSPEARETLMAELLQKFEEVRSPVRTAHRFGVEEIIDPRDTRGRACEWVQHVYEHLLPQLVTLKQSRFGLDAKPSSGRGYRL
ncbi:Propionyl-CoA carboxylase beta chain, mitochondrial [Hypsizygus marmoreus]|uniref:Propionyl-CoA carboxylase beta chain, mitochondrial n=1 Tax=Hypsizygus marmoreus TaxID=39966 RepID=A0A369KFJ7_HYPMA|nr:Propionyl-CoA carboxylase beta chain, mitochondrial [Hypsizygus marmoreus]